MQRVRSVTRWCKSAAPSFVTTRCTRIYSIVTIIYPTLNLEWFEGENLRGLDMGLILGQFGDIIICSIHEGDGANFSSALCRTWFGEMHTGQQLPWTACSHEVGEAVVGFCELIKWL